MAPKVNYFSAWEWESRFQFRVFVLYLKFLILKTETIFLVEKKWNQVFFCFSPTSKSDWKHLLQFFLDLLMVARIVSWKKQNNTGTIKTPTFSVLKKINLITKNASSVWQLRARREKKLNVCESKKKQCLLV